MEPKLSDAGAGGGEDRLSALPDDVLLHILLKLGNAPVAARTSVLARRWRRAWALLPELHFPDGTHPDGIRAALTAHDAPALGHLFVAATTEVTLESVTAWLTITARRLSGVLSFQISNRWNMAGERGALKLPCFEKATKVRLTLTSNGLVLPPSGVFTRLADLELFDIRLHGPYSLGDLVSSPRCPSLCRLSVYGVTGLLDKLTINSESLLQLELNNLPSLELLDVVALALQELGVHSCYRLQLKLVDMPRGLEEQIACQSGCNCVEPSNWEPKELVLRCLEEIEIDGFRGTEHELALVRRLFKWTTMLKRMTVHFHDLVTESKGKELCQLLLSFSRPEICMKFLH